MLHTTLQTAKEPTPQERFNACSALLQSIRCIPQEDLTPFKEDILALAACEDSSEVKITIQQRSSSDETQARSLFKCMQEALARGVTIEMTLLTVLNALKQDKEKNAANLSTENT